MESMGKISSIKEIHNVRLENKGIINGENGSRLGMAQMILEVFGSGSSFSGFEVKTNQHTYNILINDEQSCCEDWGYICSEDDTDDFIGKELIDVQLTDTALSVQRLKDCAVGYFGHGQNTPDFDGGGIQFIDFRFSDGSVLQFAVYNAHNGYYGHSIIIAKNQDIICDDTL